VSEFEITCPCGETFKARSSRAKWCSPKCRKRRQRAGDVIELPTAAAEAEVVEDERPAFTGGVYQATKKALEDAGRLDTPLGQTCLVLARRLDFPAMDTGSAISALAGRLEATLAAATRGVAVAASRPQQLQDELAARRAQHGA
jgi:hypothetical protein